MNRRTLDSYCERGIVGLVLAALVYSALDTGAVRTLEFVVVEWLVAASGLLWVARTWLEPRHNRLLFPPVGWCLLLFLGYALFHYVQADVEYTARREVLRLLVYALLFFVALNNLHKSEWAQMTLYVLVFTGTAIAIYGIVQVIAGLEHVWHFTRPEQYKGRGSGTFINPNHFAGFLGMLLPLCLASVLTGRISQPMRILLGYSALMLLGGVAVSMSRGGWIASTLMLVALMGVLGWRKQFRLRGIVVAGIAAGVMGLFFVSSQFAQTRVGGATKPGTMEHVGSRIELWGAATKVWQEEKLLGVGPGHFDHRFPAHRPVRLQSRPVRVHNDYLNTLVDWGLVGMLLAGLMLGTMVSGIIKSWKYSQRTSSDLSAKTSNRAAFVLGSTARAGLDRAALVCRFQPAHPLQRHAGRDAGGVVDGVHPVRHRTVLGGRAAAGAPGPDRGGLRCVGPACSTRRLATGAGARPARGLPGRRSRFPEQVETPRKGAGD